MTLLLINTINTCKLTVVTIRSTQERMRKRYLLRLKSEGISTGSILPSIHSADVHGSFALVAQLLVTFGRVELVTESVTGELVFIVENGRG